MSLTNFEKETIIIFNEAEPTARIETFDSRIIREAEKAATRSAAVVREERSENKHGVYTMPKTYIKIRAPLSISDETRERRSKQCQSFRVNAIKTNNKL